MCVHARERERERCRRGYEGMCGEGSGWKDKSCLATVPATFFSYLVTAFPSPYSLCSLYMSPTWLLTHSTHLLSWGSQRGSPLERPEEK